MVGLIENKKGVSIAFSVFVVFVTIVLFAIIQMGISPMVEETSKFTDQYMQDNPDKYMEEVHRNQADSYLFFEVFPIIMLITLFVWSVVNAIRRGWDSTGGE
ncbi:hypothetical protein KAW18_01490 [candidate division WOR-3 bacterium]|nr:hypothetical protein [candidate division WOR-3 bacterium]